MKSLLHVLHVHILSVPSIAAWTAAELMLEAEKENRVHWESQVGPSYHVVIYIYIYIHA